MKKCIILLSLLSSVIYADNRPDIWVCNSTKDVIHIKKGLDCTSLEFMSHQSFNRWLEKSCGKDNVITMPLNDKDFTFKGETYTCFKLHKEPVLYVPTR